MFNNKILFAFQQTVEPIRTLVNTFDVNNFPNNYTEMYSELVCLSSLIMITDILKEKQVIYTMIVSRTKFLIATGSKCT